MSNETTPSQSAFPQSDGQTWGLSKREYFAAVVLGGLYANNNEAYATMTVGDMAQEAVGAADALIAALNEKVEH